MQTESNNTSKRSSIKVHPRDTGMIQHSKVSKCNPPYKQTEKKIDGYLISAEKYFDKIQHIFMIKVLERLGTKNIPEHNKGNL